MSLLEIEHLSRRFGGLTAVDDVSARVDEGELVGLIGPNGAGKTTLFNLISGFTPPSQGRVHFRGEDVTRRKAARIARLGMSRTFQNLRVFPNMTVFDNVSVGATGTIGQSAWQAMAAGSIRADRISMRTWKALEQTGLTGEADDLAANLAYGRRKYLEIARALAMEPTLLILDEPAAGLNGTETAALARFVLSLNANGLTVMVVEHDMDFVMSICRRIVVLANGRKIADAQPQVVRADPLVLEAYLGVEE